MRGGPGGAFALFLTISMGVLGPNGVETGRAAEEPLTPMHAAHLDPAAPPTLSVVPPLDRESPGATVSQSRSRSEEALDNGPCGHALPTVRALAPAETPTHAPDGLLVPAASLGIGDRSGALPSLAAPPAPAPTAAHPQR